MSKLTFMIKPVCLLLNDNLNKSTVKYCERNSCLSKTQTPLAMLLKTRAQAAGKCLLLHEILQVLLFRN